MSKMLDQVKQQWKQTKGQVLLSHALKKTSGKEKKKMLKKIKKELEKDKKKHHKHHKKNSTTPASVNLAQTSNITEPLNQTLL